MTGKQEEQVQHPIALGLQKRNDEQSAGVHIDYKHSAFVDFLSFMTGSALIEAVNKTVFAPLERMKIIHQAQNALYINEKAKFKSFSQFIQRVPKEQGLSALWRGNFANVMSIVPRSIAQFAFLENINTFYFPQGERNISDISYGFRKLGAAVTAGFCTLLLSYPYDLAKTRLSLEFAKNKYDKQFTGILSAFGETKRRDGYSGLYRGFWLANIMNIPYFLTLFTTFQLFKSISSGENRQNIEVFKYLAPASIAGLLATFVVYPLDTIKRRIQMNGYNGNKLYKSSFDCFSKMIEKEGYGSLYKGLTVTSVKFVGSAALQTVLVAYYAHLKTNEPII